MDLSKTGVTDAGLVHLQGLTALKELCLQETRITDAGLARLYPLRIDSLALRGTQVTDAGLEEFKKTRQHLRTDR